jgi:hypothetical protein
LDQFETFVNSLTSQAKPTVTNENAPSLSLLARDSFPSELASACQTFPVSIDHLERDVSEGISGLTSNSVDEDPTCTLNKVVDLANEERFNSEHASRQ